MGELSEECAVLATDGADEKEAQRLQQMLEVKEWKGKYALPLPGTETASEWLLQVYVRQHEQQKHQQQEQLH